MDLYETTEIPWEEMEEWVFTDSRPMKCKPSSLS